MSQEKQIDQVIGLEELFLSQEFGQTPGGGTAPAGPLVPLVPTASEVAGHASTTHRRRNAFAALSGAAAALLVALGLIGGSGSGHLCGPIAGHLGVPGRPHHDHSSTRDARAAERRAGRHRPPRRPDRPRGLRVGHRVIDPAPIPVR